MLYSKLTVLISTDIRALLVCTIAHRFEKVTVPCLIEILLTQDGILKSTAAVQMRWAEKNFATLEMFYDLVERFNCSSAIYPQQFWQVPVSVSHTKHHSTTLHCPFPSLPFRDTSVFREELYMGKLRILLHLCDFLFPLFGATGSGLDKVSSKIPAVHRVNDFLKTRYHMYVC